MNTLVRVVIVLLLSFGLTFKAHADAAATLYGTVKDAKGQGIQGAEIRIQGSDANKIGKVHTDAKGHYSYPALETGMYNVTLVIGGVTKASINNVRTRGGEAQSLNFDLQGGSAKPAGTGKHYVWMPSQTGSHLGQWVEVQDDGKVMPSGMAERLNNNGNEVVRQIQSNSAATMNHQ